jgi:signal transduction histidine kinase
VTLRRRWRADIARPAIPTSREEHTFLVGAAIVIVAVAQLTDGGTAADLLLLLPAVVAFGLPRVPAELFALLVIVPVTVVVGREGALEGTFFVSVMMVYATASHLGSLTRAVVIVAAAIAAPWLVAEVVAPESGIAWQPWAMAQVFTGALGRAEYHRRRLIDELGRAQSALAAQAVAEERRRIARELHDLAGHTLAAMMLHVTGARHVLRRDVDEAERALVDAETVGRASLDQVRATVASLRTDEAGTDPPLAGVEDLAALVEEYRRAGLVVEASIAPAAAPAAKGPVGTALHRVARESLANVARHAPGNRVELQVDVRGNEVHLLVVDRGQAASAPDPRAAHFGLIGMAERARSLGGRFAAGPTSDGWRVEVELPIADARSSQFVSP